MSSLEALRDCVQSPFGIVDRIWRLPSPAGLPSYRCFGATVATVIADSTSKRDRSTATGTSFESDDAAELVCIAEALERYSAGACLYDDYVFAVERDLDGPVLNMSSLPVCSATELASPDCHVTSYDPAAPTRWAEGVDLLSGQRCWVPAGLANYRLPSRDNERFYYPISTGHAVHRTYAAALGNALLEVIERDMVAVVWLQQLALPPIAPGDLDDVTSEALSWLAENFLHVRLFDATSDLGVPVVYGLLVAPHDSEVRSWVACAAAPTLTTAAQRVVRELMSSRVRPSVAPVERPDEPEEFRSVLDGALYMAAPARAHAFDFLSDRRAVPAARATPLPDVPESILEELLLRLRTRGMHAFAVDLSSRELADAGFCAVSVIVPELQPMSLWHDARFLGHPRLYELPALLGHPVHPESELNPWPQPFP